MTNKYVFETFEELSQAFPIRSIFSEQMVISINATDNDIDPSEKIPDELKTYSASYKKIAKDKYLITKIFKNTIFIDGYIYDGKHWYPARRIFDKLQRLNEHDLFKEENIVLYGEDMEGFIYNNYEKDAM